VKTFGSINAPQRGELMLRESQCVSYTANGKDCSSESAGGRGLIATSRLKSGEEKG
jgi:hypothetical protein